MTHARRAAAEGLGTALLLAVIVGSGIMAERLADGNIAVALLGNTLPIAAALVVLIVIFGPVSGAHFNPVVTLMVLIRRDLSPGVAALYLLAQMAGAVMGVGLAHLMFAEPLWQIATTDRSAPGLALSEGVATFGLIVTILGTQRAQPTFTPAAVGLYIFAACWFTASTSFANPAVTVARALTDTFTGIAPASVLPFIAAQLAGMAAATALCRWLFEEEPAS